MPHQFGANHWYSGYSLIRDPRVMFIDADGSMRLQPITPAPGTQPEVTVIVIAGSYLDVFRPIMSLASIDYPIRIVIVLLDPKTRDEVVWLPSRYAHELAKFRIFEPTKKLTVHEAMNAGLQSIETQYVCVLGGGDMLHRYTFECLALQYCKCDWIEARYFNANPLGWVNHNVEQFKPVWRTSHVIGAGGFAKAEDDTVAAIEQQTMTRQAAHARMNAVLFFSGGGQWESDTTQS